MTQGDKLIPSRSLPGLAQGIEQASGVSSRRPGPFPFEGLGRSDRWFRDGLRPFADEPFLHLGRSLSGLLDQMALAREQTGAALQDFQEQQDHGRDQKSGADPDQPWMPGQISPDARQFDPLLAACAPAQVF
jgi:hypothetical protein